MKNMHQNTIKYLAHLVLNKRKLDNKQASLSPMNLVLYYHAPPPKGGITPLCRITVNCDQHKANGLTFMLVYGHGLYFLGRVCRFKNLYYESLPNS
jgi:hypothetical protein